MSGGAYIEGNTLVLGDSSYLEHHGILGQKWGVRRFQNKDGSRTAEGKKRYKTLKIASAKKAKFETSFGKAKNKAIDKAKEDRLNMVDDIRYGKNKSKYDDAVDEYDKATMHRYDEYEKEYDKYAMIAGMAGARRWWNDQSDDALRDGAEFYMYDDGDQSKYNSYDYFLVGKGENPNEVHARLYNATNKIMDLAKADAKEALGEYGNTKEASDFALNIFEYATAASPYSMVNESYGLTYSNDEIAEMKRDIDVYTKEAKRLGLIHMDLMVSEGTLYLEHHGIKGQRWGVRRFQNKDGSLTNAGRKRLGYSTKDVKSAVIKGGKTVGGAVATVGKTGYKLGQKAAVAVKAHSEKKKAEKLEKKKKELEKKKEEASKTRLGVVRNADLFTAAEMAELNKKFKAKDELTLASLQKGADYFRLAAGMVGAVSSINKDFESMTGKSLIPNPVKKEREKREADERAEDRARKLAKEDAEEDRKRRADERKSRADDIDFKNKSEDLKNKKSEELRKQAAEARAQEKQTWDEAQAAEKTRAMKGVADENEAKAAIKRQELKTNEIAQREEAVAKREAAADESEERINYARKEVLKRMDDADTYRDALIKATDMLRNASDLTRQQQDEVWEFIKKAQKDKLGHDGMHDSYLEHHGIKGQRWGVRRFQNPDGTLTDKGRKHYQKKLDREKRKQVSSDAMRGTLERQHGLAVGASGIITGVAGALSVAAVASNPVTIAAGAAIAASVSAGITHGTYSVAEAWEGRGSRIRKKKIAKYENMLKQDGFIVEDGTLYLEHFGIKNMKWGVRRFQNKDGSLTEAGRKRYGSGNDDGELSGGGGGGGAPEEDEEMKKKIEEAAKKAGMTVAEYRKKMGSKLYDMFGGKYKKEAEDLRKRQLESSKNARLLEKEGGKKNEDANSERVNANVYGHYAKEANKSYEKSIAGRYDKLKATMVERGKAKKKEASEQKRKGRTDQYIAGPEQNKNTKHLLDTEHSKSLRRGAERKSRDAAIFGESADEVKRKQASALGKGQKAEADYYGKQVDSIEKRSSEKIMGQRDWKGKLRDSEPYTSVRDSKRAYDKTAQGKLDKARYEVQRTKQKVYNAAGGEYKRQANLGRVYLKREKAKENRAIKRGNSYDAEAARSWQDVYRKSSNEMERAYENSLAGRYDKLKATMAERGKAKKNGTNEPRTHVLPKMKSASATAKPMRKLTSKELSKIRSEARIKQLKKDGDYTGEYKKKRRK